jgi:hypothetical protein
MTGGKDGSQVVGGAADAAGSDRGVADRAGEEVGGFARPTIFELGGTTLTLTRKFAADGSPVVVLATAIYPYRGAQPRTTSALEIEADLAREMGEALLRLGGGAATPPAETYTDGRERLEFVDLHGAFGLKLDGEATGCAVFGIYDACIMRGVLYALPAPWPGGKPVLCRYEGKGIWIKVLPYIDIHILPVLTPQGEGGA